ncbi:WALL-ASSOCIATED RECEPTOR KINASE-LIKE 21 [Salix viminalis]|uniref:WALL-ASSOCIATED RECEPTOR KINASE-LIKE 21 n=1 Tax=Salix viminalis TaxID=40686 RepID=A0A9Q0UIR2_SALVM|nr:WALL-ASSOCIATED RECEPTOR KINASE-LIKE 21 [Salix viminalis]
MDPKENLVLLAAALLWMSSKVEVLSISLDGHLRILTYVGADCYSKSGARESSTTSYAVSPAFPFSNTRNKFFGVGDIGSVTNGSCNGIGCCQIPIPGNLLNYNASVGSVGNHTDIWESNPCGFAFLAEEESFNFTIANLTSIKNTTLLPSSIDWAIGNQTCEEAKKNLTGYACKANSDCYDSSNAPGYLCNCSAGYIGNPYIPDGCQDVDECKDSNLNKCLKKCHNTIGNYTCPCPKGYHGDGRKDGEGCSADQLLDVKIFVGVGASVIILVAVSGLLYFGHEKRKLIKLKEKYFQQNGDDRLFQILEDCIAKEGNAEQVDKVARLGKTCLRVKGEERPTMKEVAMELERLRMVGKHPWTNVESNYEQTEYLLGKKIDASGHGKSGESSSGYQVIGPVLLPSGGR